MVRLWIKKSVADTRGHWFEPGKPAQLPDEEAAEFIENGMAITELDFALGLLAHHEFAGFVVNDDTSDEFKASVAAAGYEVHVGGVDATVSAEPEKPPAKKPTTRKPSTRKTPAKKTAE